MNHPVAGRSWRSFNGIAFGEKPQYRHPWLASGRVTTDDNLAFYEKPALEANAPRAGLGFAAQPDFGMYYVSIDPAGRSWLEGCQVHYETTTAHRSRC